MTTSTNNVVLLTSFDSIAISDLRGFIQVYSDIEHQVEDLREAIAPRVLDIGKHYYEQAEGVATQAAENFETAMQLEVDFITSDKAGEKKLSPTKVKLKGSSPLAAAYKKVRLALLNGANLLELESCSACAKFNSDYTKEQERIDNSVDREQAIIDHCKNVLDPKGEMDWSLASNLAALQEECESYRLRQDAGSHLSDAGGTGGDPQAEMDEFDKKGREIATALRDLYEATIPLVGDNKEFAMTQAMEIGDNFITSTKGRVKKHLASAKAKLEDVA